MRTDQIVQPIASLAWCTLIAACADCINNRFVGSDRFAVPHSPGRASCLYPYPSSRRRRRQ